MLTPEQVARMVATEAGRGQGRGHNCSLGECGQQPAVDGGKGRGEWRQALSGLLEPCELGAVCTHGVVLGHGPCGFHPQDSPPASSPVPCLL